MAAFYEMFNIVVLFVALLVPGYVLGKIKLVEGSAMVSFSNILMYIAMPALVLCKLINMDMSDVGTGEIIIAAALPALLVLVLSALSRILPMSDVARERALRFCSVFPNCGFM